jgi:hypothetical protein
VIRRASAKCPDEYPPSATTELLFINDAALREHIRRDLEAANRALNNAEWKAATVLPGAAIEALLHWRLQEPSPQKSEHLRLLRRDPSKSASPVTYQLAF